MPVPCPAGQDDVPSKVMVEKIINPVPAGLFVLEFSVPTLLANLGRMKLRVESSGWAAAPEKSVPREYMLAASRATCVVVSSRISASPTHSMRSNSRTVSGRISAVSIKAWPRLFCLRLRIVSTP